MNILKKWSLLEDNDYISSTFELTTEKSDKVDFTTLLKKSIDNFPEMDSYNLDDLLKALDNTNNRFTKAYDKYPILYKVICLFSKKLGVKATLPQYYDEFVKKIISEIVKKSKSKPIDFLDKIVSYDQEKLRSEEGSLTTFGKILAKCFVEINNEESTDIPQYYDQFITKIIFQITKNFKNNLTGLIEKSNSYHSKKFRNENGEPTILGEIFTKYLNHALSIQQQRTDIKGIFYEITNQFNCKSYLIGTLHVLPENSMSCIPSSILEKIKESGELICEVGEEQPAGGLDRFLIDNLSENGAKITALENKSFQQNIIKRIQDLPSTEWQNSLSEKKKNKLIALQILQNPINGLVAIQEAWQNGDIDALKLLVTQLMPPEQKNILFKERNKTWLSDTNFNLIPKLKNAKTPISIAVGVGHLVGKTGLLQALQKEKNLQIRQLI